jgi:hypothetical protein
VTEAPALKPIDPHNPDVQAAAYIDLARKRGVPWAVIGREFGLPDKHAIKRHRRELGKRIRQQQMID